MVFEKAVKTEVLINISDGEETVSTSIFVEVVGEKTKEDNQGILITIFSSLIVWILLMFLLFFLFLYLGKYDVEEVYLITHSGLLIKRLQSAKAKDLDEDIVSSMFTAVQEFINDTVDTATGIYINEMIPGTTTETTSTTTSTVSSETSTESTSTLTTGIADGGLFTILAAILLTLNFRKRRKK